MTGALLAGACAGGGVPAPVHPDGTRPATSVAPATRLDRVARALLDTAAARYGRVAAAREPAAGYPRSTDASGAWTVLPVREWTSGFFPGILWALYGRTHDPALRVQAERWTLPLEAIFAGPTSHDLGFQFRPTFARAYDLTGAERFRAPALRAAALLAARFNPVVGAIRSWNGMGPGRPFPVIIDNMMNLELLFWGAKHGGDPAWTGIALRHATTTRLNHVRADGSTFHVVLFDTADGRALERITHQGYADSSTWARGQAWALYGFTMTYREARRPEDLATARRTADYFLAHLPPDGVPCWDFQAPDCPGGPADRDASAAAIAASGLLELARLTTGRDGPRYLAGARHILAGLSAPPYLAPAGGEALLQHATGNRPGNSEVDVGLIYADYYFVEALTRELWTAGAPPGGPD